MRRAQCTCGKYLDGATAVNADCSPKPGDVTVCIYCLAVLAYTEGGELEPVELAKLPAEARAVVEELRSSIVKARPS